MTYEIQCDLSRMMFVLSAIQCDQNERPTLWIRFNPNAFTVDGTKVTVPKKKKYKRLLAFLTEDTIPNGTEILYMYYDTSNGLPVICQDVTYDHNTKNLLRRSIDSWMTQSSLVTCVLLFQKYNQLNWFIHRDITIIVETPRFHIKTFEPGSSDKGSFFNCHQKQYI